MNVEMFFIQTEARAQVCDLIRQRITSSPDAPGLQPDWGLPSSYDVLLAREPKRKVALSPAAKGWIAGIESKEVIDFALLQDISKKLGAQVIAVQLSEVSGCCGYALCANGAITERRFSEDDEDPSGTIGRFLAKHKVSFGLVSFREAVQMRKEGWTLV